MASDKKALALELKQIIQADRMAVDIIQRAKDMKTTIEKQTEKDKAEILGDAQRKREEMTGQVEAEMAAEMARRKEEAARQFEQQRQFIRNAMRENREKWVDEITGRIISTGE